MQENISLYDEVMLFIKAIEGQGHVEQRKCWKKLFLKKTDDTVCGAVGGAERRARAQGHLQIETSGPSLTMEDTRVDDERRIDNELLMPRLSIAHRYYWFLYDLTFDTES